MALYHKDVFMPPGLKLPTGSMSLNYGGHARMESIADRYGSIKLPNVIDFDNFEPIEVEVNERGKVVKVLYRGSLDNRRDLCIVIIPSKRFVKTVWVNLKTDKHKTLDTSKYHKE